MLRNREISTYIVNSFLNEQFSKCYILKAILSGDFLLNKNLAMYNNGTICLVQ